MTRFVIVTRFVKGKKRLQIFLFLKDRIHIDKGNTHTAYQVQKSRRTARYPAGQ